MPGSLPVETMRANDVYRDGGLRSKLGGIGLSDMEARSTADDLRVLMPQGDVSVSRRGSALMKADGPVARDDVADIVVDATGRVLGLITRDGILRRMSLSRLP